MTTETCIGCSLKTEKVLGPVHKYLASSPGCWAKFGEVLVKEYEDYEYMAVHGLTVDAYALQHPGQEHPQTINSVFVHLGSLYCYFELGKPIGELSKIKQQLTKYKSEFTWLLPPNDVGEITIADVLESETASQHCATVKKWAAYVYERWKVHHPKIAHVISIEGT